MPGKFKIKQIIPAESWYALYYHKGVEGGRPSYTLNRLISFALIETETGDTQIDAIDRDRSLAGLGGYLQGHYAGLIHETEIDDERRRGWEEAARSY